MIPDEAVEAAARAAYEFRYSGYKAWGDLTPLAQCDAEAEMRYALLAAAPHLMAAEVRRVRETNYHIKEGSGAYSSGFHFALDCIYLCNENGDAS